MPTTNTDRLLRGGIVLLSAVLVYFIYSGIHERVVIAGDSAPEFSITADNGRTVTLPNFGGKLLVPTLRAGNPFAQPVRVHLRPEGSGRPRHQRRQGRKCLPRLPPEVQTGIP